MKLPKHAHGSDPLQNVSIKEFQTPSIDWYHISLVRQMSVSQKNRQAFEAAEFALRQKRLLLRHQHPDWDESMLDQTARRLVFTKDHRRK